MNILAAEGRRCVLRHLGPQMAEEGSQGGGGLLRKVAAASLALATAGLGFYHYRQMKKDIEDEKLERKSFVEELRSHDLDW